MNIMGSKTRILFLPALLLVFLLVGTLTTVESAEKGKAARCKMQFSLSGWSAFYQTASGSGSITCDNGQSAKVRLRVKGGGLTAGKSSLKGNGTFSEVYDIGELFGSYATAEAHAGVVKSVDAQVVTKGSVSLAIKAKGSGIDLGVGFGKFVIEPIGKKGGK